MLKKATFFVLEASHTNDLRATISNRNSYPYYQDKKKLVSLVQKKHSNNLNTFIYYLQTRQEETRFTRSKKT